MKRIIIIATTFLGFVNLMQAQTKKAVFIIIDGVSKDVIEKVPTPNLQAIAKEGALISAFQGGERGQYNQTPTISAPGYNNVLTGVWFNKHNVPDNAIKAPNYHYPTIFRFFEDQYPEKQTAVFSSWQDNRTKLIGEGLAGTGAIKLDYSFDGLELDTVKYPHDKEHRYMEYIDQAITDEAASYIRKKGPDLSWVYLQFTDDMGHMFGDSKQFHDAVEAADRRVGQIWDAIQERKKQHNEEWLIVVTTDHGRDAEKGKNHGGQSDRERASWIVTNSQPLNNYAKTSLVSVVDILPTIARFLDIRIPADKLKELDGTALIGKVSLGGAVAKKEGGKIDLSWMPLDKSGKVKIWITTTNTTKTLNQPDPYTLIGEVPVKDGKFTIDLKKLPASDFYKIVLEGKYNTLNRWISNK